MHAPRKGLPETYGNVNDMLPTGMMSVRRASTFTQTNEACGFRRGSLRAWTAHHLDGLGSGSMADSGGTKITSSA